MFPALEANDASAIDKMKVTLDLANAEIQKKDKDRAELEANHAAAIDQMKTLDLAKAKDP